MASKKRKADEGESKKETGSISPHRHTVTDRQDIKKCQSMSDSKIHQASTAPEKSNAHHNTSGQTEIRTSTGCFVCQKCGKEYTKLGQLNRHTDTCVGKVPISCEECGKSFTRKTYLIAHQSLHTGQKPYSCDECGKSFVTKGSLKSHVQTHTGEKPFKCDQCGKAFHASHVLEEHRFIHSSTKQFHCDDCGVAFAQLTTLRRHKRCIHGGVKRQRKQYPCVECGQVYRHKWKLEEHIAKSTHVKVESFKCDGCHKIYASKLGLNKHKCPNKIEDSGRSNNDSLSKMEASDVSSAKRYPCNECGVTFAQLSTLRRHNRCIHGGVKRQKKQYPCVGCGQVYCYKWKLEEHMAKCTHVKVKSFKCNGCHKIYASKLGLNKHKCPNKIEDSGKNNESLSEMETRDISSTKGYPCDECEKTFTRLSALRGHKRVHTETFIRMVCEDEATSLEGADMQENNGSLQEDVTGFKEPSSPLQKVEVEFSYKTEASDTDDEGKVNGTTDDTSNDSIVSKLNQDDEAQATLILDNSRNSIGLSSEDTKHNLFQRAECFPQIKGENILNNVIEVVHNSHICFEDTPGRPINRELDEVRRSPLERSFGEGEVNTRHVSAVNGLSKREEDTLPNSNSGSPTISYSSLKEDDYCCPGREQHRLTGDRKIPQSPYLHDGLSIHQITKVKQEESVPPDMQEISSGNPQSFLKVDPIFFGDGETEGNMVKDEDAYLGMVADTRMLINEESEPLQTAQNDSMLPEGRPGQLRHIKEESVFVPEEDIVECHGSRSSSDLILDGQIKQEIMVPCKENGDSTSLEQDINNLHEKTLNCIFGSH